MSALLPELEGPALARQRALLCRLSRNAPRTLLIEGASETIRLEAGKYWAMLHNCPDSLATLQNGGEGAPCLDCAVCRQIALGEWNDLEIFDGRISNRQDEENPGPIKALRMENIRELKSLLASSPRGSGRRVILAQGIGISREEAQNSLLKVLEEPAPYNLFVLLVTQRRQILPTLVSRSFCLTFPWTGSEKEGADSAQYAAELGNFLATGQGFLEKMAQKGQMDASRAGQLVHEMQKAIVRAAAGKGSDQKNSLAAFFGRLNALEIARVSIWLSESFEMLDLGVAPARVLEGLATRLFMLGRKGPDQPRAMKL